MDFIGARITRKINSYLIFIVLISAGVFAYTFFVPGDDYISPGVSAVSGERAEAEARPLSEYSVIVEKNLFGLPSREPEREAPVEVERPRGPQMPRLKLKGTVLLASGGGYAVIEDSDRREEKTVRTGGKIGSMELLSVDWNSAFLKGDAGELELVIDPSAAPAAPSRGPVEAPSARRAAGRTGVQTFSMPQSRVDDVLANAADIMRDVTVRPVSGGFSISGIRPGSLADEFGLRDGDVIASVNRVPLDDPDNMLRVYNEVMQRGRAVVEVMRNGQRVNMIYRIER